MPEHTIEFKDQGSFTGFAYACREWGWKIVDSWYLEKGKGYAAIKYTTG